MRAAHELRLSRSGEAVGPGIVAGRAMLAESKGRFMTERNEHPAGGEHETAELAHSGESRKGIEIVTVQDVPVDYIPPSMGLGGPPPPPEDSTGGGDAAAE